mgnify:CR=1 FL=1
MDENMRSRLAESVRSFHIPRLGEIPDVGLYLEQVTRYVNQSITGCGLSPITASMVSNYVKQKIIPGPEKKAYGAESIAYLIFVSCIKSVAAMDDIRALIDKFNDLRIDSVDLTAEFCKLGFFIHGDAQNPS